LAAAFIYTVSFIRSLATTHINSHNVARDFQIVGALFVRSLRQRRAFSDRGHLDDPNRKNRSTSRGNTTAQILWEIPRLPNARTYLRLQAQRRSIGVREGQMKKDDARLGVLREYDRWAKEHPSSAKKMPRDCLHS
jgi:hypothetical protein